MKRFAERCGAAMAARQSAVCVGLDPVVEQLPGEVKARHHEPLRAIAEFCCGIIDATHEAAGVVKPQSACFERFGSRGVAVLEEVCRHARSRGMIVVLDAKRGDIGISAEHYAASALHLGADAITVNAYLGKSTVEPYLKAGLGVFVLVRTSNPDSDGVQSVETKAGGTVGEMMAGLVADLGEQVDGAVGGLSSVGCVVGATKATDAARLRAIMGRQLFLVPGYGAQGGTAADLARMRRAQARGVADAGVLVNASRSIIYAKEQRGEGWMGAARAAAEEMRREIGE